jgi:hypothetical protein
MPCDARLTALGGRRRTTYPAISLTELCGWGFWNQVPARRTLKLHEGVALALGQKPD